ncbi:hypothetical protein LCGC14_2823930, partial [marine sediment metagenome]
CVEHKGKMIGKTNPELFFIDFVGTGEYIRF